MVGTVHDADTAQLPQSISPVAAVSFMQAGWVCGAWRSGASRDHLSGAVALVVPKPQDIDVVRRRRVLTLKLRSARR